MMILAIFLLCLALAGLGALGLFCLFMMVDDSIDEIFEDIGK